MRIHSRFLLLTVPLIVGLLTAVILLERGTVEAPLVEHETDRLWRELDLANAVLSAGGGLPDDPRFAALELGGRLGTRVTLVAPDGRVLGDSGVPGGDVRDMANHADRPEVRAALRGQPETVQRFSATVGADLLYAAVLTEFGGEPVVLRLGLSLAPVQGALRDHRRSIYLMGAGALLLLLLGGGLLTRRLDHSLDSLERGVLALSDGDFGALPRSEGLAPELQSLAAALNRTAEEFGERMMELEGERAEVLALVDSIAEGVIALTEDARVFRMNRAAGELLEVTLPVPFAPIGTLVRNPALRDYLEESVVLPLPPREFSMGGRHLLISAHLLDGGGSVVTFLDVSDLRRMEKIRRDFVANASHELKTPLTSMRGFAETLLEGDTPEGLQEEFLNAIRKNTIRLQNLVDDLLDLSRLESGAWALVEEEVEVADAAREVWKEMGLGSDAPPTRFSIRGDGVALADSRALHQIFRNLFENAVRFTPPDGTLEVVVEPRGPELRIAVRDSGAGIPSTALPRIFERFYRVDAGRDRGAGGTGLGLAIVRHLVQSMGGEVGATSQLGQGTEIHFTLPAVDAS